MVEIFSKGIENIISPTDISIILVSNYSIFTSVSSLSTTMAVSADTHEDALKLKMNTVNKRQKLIFTTKLLSIF